jgi:hypothetical protein
MRQITGSTAEATQSGVTASRLNATVVLPSAPGGIRKRSTIRPVSASITPMSYHDKRP